MEKHKYLVHDENNGKKVEFPKTRTAALERAALLTAEHKRLHVAYYSESGDGENRSDWRTLKDPYFKQRTACEGGAGIANVNEFKPGPVVDISASTHLADWE